MWTRVWQRVRALSPLAILAIGFAALVIYAFPGFMSPDSCLQLSEARAGEYSNWHPPIMAALWRQVDHIVPGPFGMLAIQASAFLAGAYRLLCRAMSPRAAAWCAVGVLLFPPIVAPMAVVWKDCQMAAFFLLGFSLLLDERPRNHWIGVALLGLATGMRANGLTGTLPLFAFAGWRAALAWWKQLAIGIVLWLAVSAAAFGVNTALTDHVNYAGTSILAFDVVGTLRYSRKYSDAELEELLAGTPLVKHDQIDERARKLYAPENFWDLMVGDNRLFDFPATPEHVAAIQRAWREIVTAHPYGYLVHRWQVFRQNLALDKHQYNTVWAEPTIRTYTELHQDSNPSWLQQKLANGLRAVAVHTPLFRGIIYFAVALVFLPLVWRERWLRALLASGLCYELALFLIAPGADFRYTHWLIITTVIVTIALFVRRFRATPGTGPHTVAK